MSDQADLGPEEEFSELVNANLPRADLVGKGANGVPFLVAKAAQGGLVSADAIRGLLGGPEGPPELVVPLKRDDVTISGSPAAVMKMIHEAAQRASSNQKGDAMSDEVTKADAEVEVTDLVGEAPGGSTAESVPGSADWEALDAETALNAVGVLGRVKGALTWLAGREAQEAVSGGDPGDAENAFDLEDAACQLDWIIRCLGAFATTETLEADVAEELDEVAKAAVAGAVSPLLEALGVIETYGPVAKAGRVLSTANEQLLRGAGDSIQKVLASLPAPIEDGAAVTKEAVVDETTESVEADVEKAKGDPVVIAYNSSGKAIGIIDPADLMPIADEAGGDDAAADDAAVADDGSAADGGDLTPEPAADAGTPADAGMATAPVAEQTPPDAADDENVAKEAEAGAEKDQEAVLKALVDERVKEALQGIVTAEEHATVVKALEDQIAHLAAPAPSRVLSQGALPPAHQLRGQDQGSSEVEVAKAAELRERLASTHDVSEREAIQTALNELAVAAWTSGRAAARSGR